MDAKELHDQLLASKPDNVEHDAAVCPLCVLSASAEAPSGSTANKGGQPVSDPVTFTQAELDMAIAKAISDATSPLQSELDSLRAAAANGEVEAQIAALRTEHDTKVAELQAQLDAEVLAHKAVADELASLKTFLDEEATKAAQAAEVASRIEARTNEVKEVAAFPDEYVTANAERWAGMDDEAFATYIADLKVVAAKSGDGKVPAKGTALTASREDGSTSSTVSAGLSAIREMREAGADPRTL